ncbi:ATP-binding protein [Phenylobacterium sp.]|jgi:two-component system osmolarity sensor histidine kinase EnvZ|uniref:ATP-binding protein n=1 Tax=Phenylobacterium sp. TaxID=1871053 RepID=UPI0037839316
MQNWWPRSLIGRSMLLIGAILGLQLAASIFFYVRIERETLREDHARRVAEFLVVSRRVHALAARGQPDVDRVMTSRFLEADILEANARPSAKATPEGEALRRAIVRWEPELAASELVLWTPRGGKDLAGAMRLEDGRWLSFRSRDFASMWPTAVRVMWMTVLFAVLCLAFAALSLKALGRPLRDLAQAARAFGRGPHAPVTVEGSADLRDLGRAFNEMQDRITGLIEDQARSMEAISHDLRTPLARMQLATQFVEPEDIRTLLTANVEELGEMLRSLSAFLRAQHQQSEAETVDLAALVRDALGAREEAASYDGPESLPVQTHRAPLEEALKRLLDNAFRYGGGARVTLDPAGPKILIHDRGAGMSPEDLEQIYRPFFRADLARARNTAGFGLGVPTAARLLTRFGGDLEIANAPSGGLLVTITPPRAA